MGRRAAPALATPIKRAYRPDSHRSQRLGLARPLPRVLAGQRAAACSESAKVLEGGCGEDRPLYLRYRVMVRLANLPLRDDPVITPRPISSSSRQLAWGFSPGSQ